MSTRKTLVTLGLAIAIVSPLAAVADGFWVTTADEPGSRIVAPQSGSRAANTPPADSMALRLGALSDDRQFVYLGEESGWQLRPMQYEVRDGRLIHVDDPAGHMERYADSAPLTELERQALERSAGA